MKTMRLGWVVVTAWVLGCATASPSTQTASTAQPPASTTAQAASTSADKGAGTLASAKQDPEKTLVCEEQALTGSRIPKKTCRTLRQHQAEREAAQKLIRDAEKINREMGN